MNVFSSDFEGGSILSSPFFQKAPPVAGQGAMMKKIFKNLGRKNLKSRGGFTLVETMVAAVIMIGAFTAVLLTYIKCIELSELSKNSSIALSLAKNRIEAAKNTAFFQITAQFNGVSFATGTLNGQGISYVTSNGANLLTLTVSVCWKQGKGTSRLIGEDADLDGVLDAGEDKNGNGRIDSPVQIVSMIYNGG